MNTFTIKCKKYHGALYSETDFMDWNLQPCAVTRPMPTPDSSSHLWPSRPSGSKFVPQHPVARRHATPQDILVLVFFTGVVVSARRRKFGSSLKIDLLMSSVINRHAENNESISKRTKLFANQVSDNREQTSGLAELSIVEYALTCTWPSCQSDKHWYCLEGNVGKTSVRRGRAHICLFRAHI